MDDPLVFLPEATLDPAQGRAEAEDVAIVKSSEKAIANSQKLLAEIAAKTAPIPLLR